MESNNIIQICEELRAGGMSYPKISAALLQRHGIIKSVDQLRSIIGDKSDKFVKSDKPNPVIELSQAPQRVTLEMQKENIIRTAVIELSAGEEKNPRSVMVAHGFDPDRWEVVNCVNNFWQSQARGGILLDLYQSRLTVKPIKDSLSFKDIEEHYRTFVPKVLESYIYSPQKCIAEVNIADLHLGKLAWHGDTGTDFDTKIAKSLMTDLVTRICSSIKPKNPEYILFVWSNDFFNADNPQQTTTGGTPQDVDCRWQKMYNIGCEILTEATERLRKIAPVKMFYTRSNHDQQTGYHALMHLWAYYRDCKDVTVDIDAYPRKYIEYGNTCIGFTHGDKESPSRLSGLMPLEAKEIWGRTKFREFHSHHLHSEHAIEEINGVLVRRISSPTATDTWHAESGYIGAVRKAQTFIYDCEDGLTDIINTPVR